MRSFWHALTRPRGPGAAPEHRWARRQAWNLTAVAFYLVGWFVIGGIVEKRDRFVDVSISLDHQIPLVVEWAWGYALIFLMITFAMVFIRSGRIFKRAAQGVMFQTAIAFVFFSVMPVKMYLRPDELVHGMSGASATLTSFFYFIDRPLNCFPSMHLALGVWSGLLLIEDYPRFRVFWWAAIVAVGVSVVFVRQHFVLDAVAGVTLCLFTRWLFFRVRRSAAEDALEDGVDAPQV